MEWKILFFCKICKNTYWYSFSLQCNCTLRSDVSSFPHGIYHMVNQTLLVSTCKRALFIFKAFRTQMEGRFMLHHSVFIIKTFATLLAIIYTTFALHLIMNMIYVSIQVMPVVCFEVTKLTLVVFDLTICSVFCIFWGIIFMPWYNDLLIFCILPLFLQPLL